MVKTEDSKTGDSRTIGLNKKSNISEERQNQILGDLKELCLKASPSEDKVKEVASKVGFIIDRQN